MKEDREADVDVVLEARLGVRRDHRPVRGDVHDHLLRREVDDRLAIRRQNLFEVSPHLQDTESGVFDARPDAGRNQLGVESHPDSPLVVTLAVGEQQLLVDGAVTVRGELHLLSQLEVGGKGDSLTEGGGLGTGVQPQFVIHSFHARYPPWCTLFMNK